MICGGDWSRSFRCFALGKGAAYRVTTLAHPRPESILLGQRSFLDGGQWNAIGSFRAVYGSTADTLAVAESRVTAEDAKIPGPFRTPRLLIAIDLSLQAVLDLTKPATCAALGFAAPDLQAEDWRRIQEGGSESFTQAIGRAVFSAKGEGLLVPSAKVQKGGECRLFSRESTSQQPRKSV